MKILVKFIKALIKDREKIKLALLYKFARLYHSDELFLRKLYKLRMGYNLNLNPPITFSEKLQWLKLHYRKPEFSQMVDKVCAKEYVSKLIGSKYIIPTIAVFESVDDIDLNILPEKFVLKCTHDSGGIIICDNKLSIDETEIKQKFHKWLRTNYFYQNREWPYKNIKPRIIAEQYMETSGQDLPDYKFFCFNGKPEYCQVICGRKTEMTIDFYDKDWNHQPFHEPKQYPFCESAQPRPLRYDEMWEIAATLAKGHPFIRVDLYEVNGCIFFGELTFYPTSGMGGFFPSEWDKKFGDMIELPVVCNRNEQ